MRGRQRSQTTLYVGSQLEDVVPKDHPLRNPRRLADEELRCLSPRFEKVYPRIDRPSIPREQLIRASLLQALFSIRLDRQLCDQLSYSLLYKWFAGLDLDAKPWDLTTSTKNRDRFQEHGLPRAFFEGKAAAAIVTEADKSGHFRVDGTLIQSWASLKSLRPKDEKDGDNKKCWSGFTGEKCSNETHASKTDPKARLMCKPFAAPEALCHSLRPVMDNHHSLLKGISVAESRTKAEAEQAKRLVNYLRRRQWVRPRSLTADKLYDTRSFLK